MKELIQKALALFGLRLIVINRHAAPDLLPEIHETFERCRPFTMTSFERIAAVCAAVEYTVANGIRGDFVECGVWRGGSSMAAALTYLRLGRSDVDFYLFDTYEGMSAPTEYDFDAHTGRSAKSLLEGAGKDEGVWAYAPLADVQANLGSTGYPSDRLHFIQGKVEDTVPAAAPTAISILRLDTDWYESTKHELEQLFPRLTPGGVLGGQGPYGPRDQIG